MSSGEVTRGTVNLGTGGGGGGGGDASAANQATEIARLADIITSLGTILAQLQASIAVTGAFFQATQPVSGPLTDAQLRATAVPVSGTVATGGLTDTQLRASAVPISGTVTANAGTGTQAVSAATLPLPALAATSTKQSDGSHKTQVVDGSGNVIGATSNALDINIKSGNPTTITATQATGTNLHTVVDSGVITTVSAVTAITNALPAGANLLGKFGIDQTTPGTTNKVSLGTDVVHTIIDSGAITTLPAITGTVTANAGSNLNTSALALDSTVAKDASLTTLNAKDFATGAKQDTAQTSLTSLAAKDYATQVTLAALLAAQPSTAALDGQTVAFGTDYIGRRIQEAQYIQNLVTSMNTIISSESETSQRIGFELR